VEREKVLTMSGKTRILVAPLDWGLGHATRCISIIRELLEHNTEVIIAADGRPYELLKKEFPSLSAVQLPGFTVAYPEGNRITAKIVSQFPKIIISIFREHKALSNIIRNFKIDAVISDNRFGLFSKQIPCVYVTHQIGIMMPKRLQWASRIVYFLNKALIQKYTACWIPDYEEEDNLSGWLSHYYPLPKNATFIGPLTRFKKISNVPKEYDILVMLSGPEPQRTVLENIMMEQLKLVRRKSLVVRGIPEKTQHMKLSEWISVVSSLDSEALNRTMLAAEIIVTRPGYSTIMDLDVLGKRAIFIPTPGQTEQEYLAAELKRSGKFYIQEQDNFSLVDALEQVKHYPGFSPRESSTSTVKVSVEKLLEQLQGEQIKKVQ